MDELYGALGPLEFSLTEEEAALKHLSGQHDLTNLRAVMNATPVFKPADGVVSNPAHWQKD